MKKNNDRSSLFLVELVIDLFLFALCAAVCVGLLVHARGLSRESTRLTQAVYLAQSIAEEWKAAGTVPETRGADENGLVSVLAVDGSRMDIAITGEDGALIYALEGVTRLE